MKTSEILIERFSHTKILQHRSIENFIVEVVENKATRTKICKNNKTLVIDKFVQIKGLSDSKIVVEAATDDDTGGLKIRHINIEFLPIELLSSIQDIFDEELDYWNVIASYSYEKNKFTENL